MSSNRPKRRRLNETDINEQLLNIIRNLTTLFVKTKITLVFSICMHKLAIVNTITNDCCYSTNVS